MRMRLDDGRSKPRLWEAMAPFAPKPEALAAYACTYYCDEIDTVYELFVEAGVLKIKFRPGMRITLSPVYEDAFQGAGKILRFMRDPAGGITGFLVYAGRVRHLRFTRR
jgi:hypothetical protein